jgi:hypothetical protein
MSFTFTRLALPQTPAESIFMIKTEFSYNFNLSSLCRVVCLSMLLLLLLSLPPPLHILLMCIFQTIIINAIQYEVCASGYHWRSHRRRCRMKSENKCNWTTLNDCITIAFVLGCCCFACLCTKSRYNWIVFCLYFFRWETI